MLNDIKGIIKQKTDFLEAASIMFEDGSGQNLDDVIILGEEAEVPPSPQEESSDDDNLPKEDSTEDEDAESSEEPKVGDGEEKGGDENHPDTDGDGEIEDIGDLPIEDPVSSPVEPQDNEDDLLNADINEPPMPLPGSDLPTPIGAQTGEPINPEDDLLNVEIDLGSNTVKDVLPVPPANANEALADGSDTQHVDSGFGGATGGSDDLGMTESAKEESVGDVNTLCSKLNKQIVSQFKTLLNKNATMSKLTDVCEKIISDISKSKNTTFTDGDNFCVNVTGNIDFQHGVIAKAIGDNDKISGVIRGITKEVTKNVNGAINDEKYKLEIDEEHYDSIAVYFPKNQFDISKIKESLSNNKKSDNGTGKESTLKESAKPFWESFFQKPGDSFSEAITLGDDTGAEAAPPVEDPGAAATEEPAAETPASGEEESEVTSAVRDKVAEVESPAPAESGDGAKEDLLKKLGNITKNLEDAKKAVMSAIQ